MTLADGWSWLSDLLTLALLLLGAIFYLAGTLGLLRFPDTLTRLHAVTKADNLGLGLLCLGLAWQVGLSPAALQLLLIWGLTLLASAVSCHLIARHTLQTGEGDGDP